MFIKVWGVSESCTVLCAECDSAAGMCDIRPVQAFSVKFTPGAMGGVPECDLCGEGVMVYSAPIEGLEDWPD